MRFQLLVCLLLAAVVSGQTAPPAAAPAAAPSAAPASAEAPANAPQAPPEVKPDDPVLTIKGLCNDAALQGDACKTVITRAQFEKLADSLQPGMSPAMRRQLATAYARMLAMSTAAEKRDLDKTPHFEEATHFARMQILSQELGRSLQADSNKVSDEEILDYYQKNTANYDQATFVRIFVPHSKRFDNAPVPPAKTATAKAGASKTPAAPKTLSAEEQAEQQKSGEEAMKKEANLLRARAVKGEDPDKLQKEAFAAAGLPGTPPSTKMEKMRRTSLPADHKSVMDLKVSEFSEVISDASGNYIYELVSKETLPLDDKIKGEIRSQLAAQRYREAMQHYQNNADLNDAYFGPSRPAMPQMPRGPRPPAAKPDDDDRD